MSYVDLRPNRIGAVQVLTREGRWVSGMLEVYNEDASGWMGYVRYAADRGEVRLEWLPKDRVRQPAP